MRSKTNRSAGKATTTKPAARPSVSAKLAGNARPAASL